MSTHTLKDKVVELLTAATYKAIASRAGCDTSTIFRIRNGHIANPSYSVGKAIDEMHLDHTKAKRRKPAA